MMLGLLKMRKIKHRQNGSVLLISLLILLLLTSLGLASMDLVGTQLKIGHSSRQYHAAFLQAEQALTEAEAVLMKHFNDILRAQGKAKPVVISKDPVITQDLDAIRQLPESWWNKNGVAVKAISSSSGKAGTSSMGKNNSAAFGATAYFVIGAPQPVRVARIENSAVGRQEYKYVAYPVLAKGKVSNGGEVYLASYILGIGD